MRPAIIRPESGSGTTELRWGKECREPCKLDTAEGQVQQVIDTRQKGGYHYNTPGKGSGAGPPPVSRLGNSYLSVRLRPISSSIISPMELPLLIKMIFFQYYNDNTPADEMIFKRTPSQVGRNVELCHPPKYLDKVNYYEGSSWRVRIIMKCGSKSESRKMQFVPSLRGSARWKRRIPRCAGIRSGYSTLPWDWHGPFRGLE